MAKIQIIVICTNLIFLAFIARLIIKAKLREEYAIVWLLITVLLALFSFWRKGLDVVSKLFGVYEPANFVFTGFIFFILIYLYKYKNNFLFAKFYFLYIPEKFSIFI